jgi:hypothetical protein
MRHLGTNLHLNLEFSALDLSFKITIVKNNWFPDPPKNCYRQIDLIQKLNENVIVKSEKTT